MRISGISGDIRILGDIRISSLSQKIKFFRESFNFEGFLTHLGLVFPDLFIMHIVSIFEKKSPKQPEYKRGP